MKSARARNFHLPLPEPLHRRLRTVADRAGEPATAVARKAIEYWLDEDERAAVRESLAEYARSEAGRNADLDIELEQAAVESLLGDRRKTKK